MNVKFKMPKFGRQLTGKGFLKEIGMTTLATTISIVLTFGTAALIEQRQKKQSGRQTAMMVIHDIDENIVQLRDIIRDEQAKGDLARQVLQHVGRLDLFSSDSLYALLSYITEDDPFAFDHSKERIFHSSQEAWKTIDSPLFIDLIQQFYAERHQLEETVGNYFLFRKPVSNDQFYRDLLASPGFNIHQNLPAILSPHLSATETRNYITFSLWRANHYSKIANEWQRKSDQLKFIMGITDDELSAYVERQERTGSPVGDRQLVGRWRATSTSDEAPETIEFHGDHTFTHIHREVFPSMLYSGHLVRLHIMRGTWSIQGDSLVRDYLPGDSLCLDASKIDYQPELKDTVQRYLAQMSERLAVVQEQRRDRSLGHRVNACFIDTSGRKIELSRIAEDDDGTNQRVAQYMVRE